MFNKQFCQAYFSIGILWIKIYEHTSFNLKCHNQINIKSNYIESIKKAWLFFGLNQETWELLFFYLTKD